MAHPSHKREAPKPRRKPAAVTLAATLAVVATGAAVATGVGINQPEPEQQIAIDPAAIEDLGDSTVEPAQVDPQERRRVVSRSSGGREGVADAGSLSESGGAATGAVDAVKRWTTEDLNLWTGPGDDASQLDVVSTGEVVYYTGRTLEGRDEIVLDGENHWVTAGYLAKEKPEPEESVGSDESGGSTAAGTDGTCTNGTSVSSGVSPSIVEIHEAVCARWPSISTYGTFRGGGGDHGTGHAVDIMISGGTGWDIAEYLRANYSAFGINYIIYSQKIWSVQRSGEGWRYMEDRGSTTANHYDHVHVSVY